MPLLTHYQTFFISPFGEPSVCDELNKFLSSHRIVNVEKRLIDGERGTGWLFLAPYEWSIVGIGVSGSQDQSIAYAAGADSGAGRSDLEGW
ncbi:MAG: hypothetical protein LBO67_02095 [Spirochaetaceae bacterium]|nr:hypothetical protein [Spirochaetaceae bacterium]